MKLTEISILLLYFLLTIVAFSSLGVTLPLVLDHYDLGFISEESCKMISSNLITYSVVIFATSLVDRVIQLFKKGTFHSKALEFLILLILVVGGAFYLAYNSMWFMKFDAISNSIEYAIYFTLLTWALWFYVKTRDSGYNNYSSLGGDFS